MKHHVALFALLGSVPATLGLWPIPRSLETGTSALKLAANFNIELDVPNPPADLSAAVSRSANYIKTDNLERLVVDRGASNSTAVAHAPQLKSLVLSLESGSPVRSIMEEATLELGTRREEYKLDVPASGASATLTANSTLGLLRGLSTFEQLWYDLSGETYTIQAPISVVDTPAYPFRGFMLDTARNYFAVSDIKRTLDAMSWVKMSQLHWHVVDSQSFPIQITGFMDLAEKGAYSSSMIYTPEDVQDIVQYAGERGIDVMVEIDMPGHTAIISEAHPDFVACAEASPWATFASGEPQCLMKPLISRLDTLWPLEPPAGQLRFASAAVQNFTVGLLNEVAKMFPSNIVSTGGDELNTECYTEDAETQAILQETGQDLEQALSGFIQAAHGTLKAQGKTPAVWEEMVLDHNVTLSNDTVVLVWISSMDAAAVAAKNFRIVHAPSDYFYLDCGAGEWIGSDPEANSWCDPFKTWQKSYTFDPLANLTEAQTSLVLGGEQLLWTEQSSPANLDPIVWPRAASSAEVFWTGATLPGGKPRNGTEALPRLHDVAFRMAQRGIRAIPLQPLWCALRPGKCNLNS
ncbi:glycoside hydrolase family 20 protein [Gelatoporia subvermispora B]|uniref:Beta-hexosaminidase n=1 Tax=Ceriporiopsis subvermispora (strain B) TaxID=914234 RepID=M2R4Y2_CERS8|nr:glycoside hydrolase family 20 protein [Gelatoporia subvermispora B]